MLVKFTPGNWEDGKYRKISQGVALLEEIEGLPEDATLRLVSDDKCTQDIRVGDYAEKVWQKRDVRARLESVWLCTSDLAGV